MKYASLIRIGGELILASEADYSDYFGFLRCPECSESVFLRKGFTRKDGTDVRASFVHHKISQQSKECELRVDSYTSQQIIAKNTQAKNQRLKSLQLHLHKYLKVKNANTLLFFTPNWKRNRHLKHTCRKVYLDFIALFNTAFFVEEKTEIHYKTLEFINNYDLLINTLFELFNSNPKKPLDGWREEYYKSIVNLKKNVNWELHIKICREVVDFLYSDICTNLLEKFYYSILFYICLVKYPEQPDKSEEIIQSMPYEILRRITFYVSLAIVITPWQTIFEEVEKAPNSKLRNALLAKLR
jgi:hypothetical protein